MNVPVKRGMLLRHREHLYFVEEIVERHTGQQRPTIHLKLRAAEDGRHLDRTLDEMQPLEEVAGSYRAAQYLYAKAGVHVFMDSQSFEEVEVAGAALGGFEPFLKEGGEYRIYYAGDKPLHVDVPDSVVLNVANTAAPAHGAGAASNVLKEALLDNGLTIRVPLFIKNGDAIRVNCQSRQYLSKAN